MGRYDKLRESIEKYDKVWKSMGMYWEGIGRYEKVW